MALKQRRRPLTELQVLRQKRDRAVVRAYRAGATAEKLARKHGLSVSGVRSIIARRGAQLTEVERRRRWSIGLKAMQTNPEFCRRRAEGVRKARSKWPDCPPHLRDHYRHLVRMVPASEARAMLEQDMQRGAC